MAQDPVSEAEQAVNDAQLAEAAALEDKARALRRESGGGGGGSGDSSLLGSLGLK
jgi:hypothetical protein